MVCDVLNVLFVVDDLARVLDAKSNRCHRRLSRNGSLSHRECSGREADVQDDRRDANKPVIHKTSFGLFGL